MSQRNCIRVVLVVALLLAAAPAAFAGDNPIARPFWGSLSGEATFPPIGAERCGGLAGWWDPILTHAATRGALTHLGLTRFEGNHCPTYDGRAERGQGVFTAANGDEIWVTYRGDTVVPGDAVIVQENEFVIYGGTGRFENASGRVNVTVYAVFEGFEDPSWPLRLVFAGTIVY